MIPLSSCFLGFISPFPLSSLSLSLSSRSLSHFLSSPPVDPSEVLSADPVDLQCVPMEAHFCPLPKLLMAAPVALNPVTLP